MPITTASATANSNIAFIKYWGNRDDHLRLPASGSISMNLDGLQTQTTVTVTPDAADDEVIIGGTLADGNAAGRVSRFLDIVRTLAGTTDHARVSSANNFPTGAGIASSASAFAALAIAGSHAYGLNLDERALSALARRGSGSASRSIPAGFVEWYAADTDAGSYAESFAPVDHWALVDCVAIVSRQHKETGSTEGHAIAATSPLQSARLATAPQRLAACKQAVLDRDFTKFADVVELDSTVMHSVMMTGSPALFYWQPATLAVMDQVRRWRASGIPVCYTIDAGANVHCLCETAAADTIQNGLMAIPGVADVLRAGVGGGAKLQTA
jgi:diphosphomevalonate decarboxylase